MTVHSYDILLDVLVVNQTDKPMHNLCLELVVGEVDLRDLGQDLFASLAVGLVVVCECELDEVDLNVLGSESIESVCGILEASQDLVAAKREGQDLTVGLEAAPGLDCAHHGVLHLDLLRVILFLLSIIKCKEELKRLIESILLLPLLRVGMLEVEDVQPVASIDLHAIAVRVNLVEWLVNAAVIVKDESSVLDELDRSLLERGDRKSVV